MGARLFRYWSFSFVALACACISLSAHAAYKTPERINLIIGYGAGGGYDITGRWIAPFLSKHLPGNPIVVVQNMPGAGSLKAANYIYNAAPKDGTAVAIVGQGIQLMEILGQRGIQFKADKFTWIGRMTQLKTLIGVWRSSPAKTIADTKTKEISIAVGGPLSGSTLYVAALNALTGTKMKPIVGYSAREALLAMERKEIDGSASLVWSELISQYPTWISEKKVRILVQVASERDPALSDVPLMTELGPTDEDRKILNAIASSDIGRSLIGPPGIPADTVTVLRKALWDALHDPEALQMAKKLRLDLDLAPLEGKKLQQQVKQTGDLSPGLVKKIRQIVGRK